MKVGTIRERLLQRVSEVLQEGSTDEVFLVTDQLRVVAGALAHLASDEEVAELPSFTVDTSQAARMLNYHAEHVRRLIRQNTIRAAKAGADYRIPLSELFAVLVKRHREDYQSTPDLLPSLQPIGVGDAASGQVELAIDVSMLYGRDRRAIRVQRFNLDLRDVLGETPAIVDGQDLEHS
jgi:excisionase family DNA binding protein